MYSASAERCSYTNNGGAGGAWTTPVVLASNASGPSIVVAEGLANAAELYQDRGLGGVYGAQAPLWSGTRLSGYGPDQGPTLTLSAHGGNLYGAYEVTPGAYGTANVFYVENAGIGWQSTQVANLVSTPAGLDISIDGSGSRYIVSCDGNNQMKIYSDRSGAWKMTPEGGCLNGTLDALIIGAKIYVAYPDTSVQERLTVSSFDLSSL